MGFLKLFLIVVTIVIVGVVGVLGYLGFVPGVSNLFGSNKPRDLGVQHTGADLASAQEKLSQEFVEPTTNTDPYEQLKASGSSAVDASFSQEEFSAHLEKVNPIEEVQVKIEGSSFEMSGKIVKSRILGFVRTLGLTGASDAEILDVVNKYLPVNPIFYISGTGAVSNNQVSVSLKKAEIGRLPVSTDTADQMLGRYVELVLEQAPGFSAESIALEENQLHFKGTSTNQIPKY